MNGYREDTASCCFHPNEVVIGVCPKCLNERLLVLGSLQGHLPTFGTSRTHRTHEEYVTHNRKSSISYLPKIFAFGSLTNRRNWMSDDKYDHYASSSHEDSFISIKFEDNDGIASWEKGSVPVSKISHSNNKSKQEKKGSTKESSISMSEHAKDEGSFRWRKRIGNLFQPMKWNRSNKASVCHVDVTKVEGVKVRNNTNSWIRTLTKRRAKGY